MLWVCHWDRTWRFKRFTASKFHIQLWLRSELFLPSNYWAVIGPSAIFNIILYFRHCFKKMSDFKRHQLRENYAHEDAHQPSYDLWGVVSIEASMAVVQTVPMTHGRQHRKISPAPDVLTKTSGYDLCLWLYTYLGGIVVITQWILSYSLAGNHRHKVCKWEGAVGGSGKRKRRRRKRSVSSGGGGVNVKVTRKKKSTWL